VLSTAPTSEPARRGGPHLTASSAAGAAAPARPAASDRLAGIHPLLFAAYPVLFLWSQNLGEADPVDVMLPLVVLVVGAAVLTWVLGRVLGDIRRGALIVSPLAIGLLMYGHVSSYVSGFGIPGIVQQLGWSALVGLAVIAAVRLDIGRIAQLDRVLTRLATVLIIVTLILILPFQAQAVASRGERQTLATRGTETSAPKRDVYWLIFDRYGSDRSLEMLHGIQNDLTPWLREQGFTVLDDSHANYVRTALSVMTTLNMTHMEDLEGLPGPDSSDLQPVYDLTQDSLVARQFKDLGYRYYHIGSWWAGTRQDRGADVSMNVAGGFSDFVDALVEESALPAIQRRLGMGTSVVDRRARHYTYNEFGLEALAGLADEPGPKFVFAHILLPHRPYVFDRDGSFMSTDEQAGMGTAEVFDRQLDYTNTRLREILGDLLALPEDERPIIILQADEGPYPDNYNATRDSYPWASATPDELEIKYGIINAWYLPGGEDLGLYPTMTSINTFPVLFDRYFGLDYPTLPDRAYTSTSWVLPYGLTDITDRLPSLQEP
jgi:hypothetical protein